MKRLFVAVVAIAALSAHANVTGALVTPDGKAIAGARVSLRAAAPFSDRFQRFLDENPIETLASAQSDAKGNFKVGIETRGNYVLQIEAQGFAPVAVGTTGEGDLGGILVRPAALKRGRVSANGKPVAGARLWLTVERVDVFATTGEDGSYMVPDPEIWRPAFRVAHADHAVHEQPSRMDSAPLDIVLRGGVELRGRVLEADGRSGAAATLRVDGIARGTTREDGSFAIAGLPSTWQTLIAVSGKNVASVERGGPPTLRLAPAQTVAGTILDARTKLPLPGATVSLARERFAAILVSATTDAKGRFEFPAVPRGKFTLISDHTGYADLAREFDSGAALARPIYLQPKARLSGFVTDERRAPVAGARVTARARSRQAGGGRIGPHVSAPDGRYVSEVDPWVLSLSEGAVDVVASHVGYAPRKDGPHTVKPGEQLRVDLVLTQGITIRGRVLHGEGDALSGVRVAALERETKNAGTYGWSVQWDDQLTTDATGAFALQLRPAAYDVYFHKPGFAPKKLVGIDFAKDSKPLEVSLEPAATISGRVVSATGEAQPDLAVNAHVSDGPPVHATTDQSGAFTLEGLTPGRVGVSFMTSDRRVEESHSLTAPAQNVTITLLPTVSISGRVTTREGNPVTVFTAAITDGNSYGGPERSQTFEEPDGRFAIRDVPVKQAALRVSAPGYASSQIALQLEQGKSVDDLQITLAQAGTVSGTVRTRGGGPLDGVRLIVGGSQRPPVHAMTDADGEYTLSGIPLGKAEISIHKGGYPPATKNIEVSRETRLDVEMQVGKTLSGRVISESGVPIADAQVSTRTSTMNAGWAQAKTDQTGRFTLEGLTSGLLEVRASRLGYVDARLEAVDVETAGELTLTLATGATITGRLVGIDVHTQKPFSVAAVGDLGQVSGVVNPDGTYRIEGAGPGKVGIRAWGGTETRRASELVTLETSAGANYTVDLEFREHNTIRGRVSRNGVPVRDGGVSFIRTDQGRSAAHARITEEGTYELTGVENGTYDVRVFTPGIETRYTVRRSINGSQTLDIDMQPVTLTVIVTNGATGEALPDAEVVALTGGPMAAPDAPRAMSGADGRAILRNLSPGDYELRVTRESFATTTSRRTLAGGNDQVDVRLHPAEGVQLSVVDSRNGKRVYATVTARDQAGTIVYSGRPEHTPDGVLRVPVGPGTYRLNIFTPGLEMAYTTAMSPGTHEVVLRPGGILEFETSKPTSVRVLASDGTIYNLDAGETATTHVILDGTYVTDMAVGTYTVQVLDANGGVARTERVEIRAGERTKLRL